MDQKKRKSGGGFGLHSVQERMRLIYKDNARFRINLVPTGGTRVTLELPYET
jgi:signal transduction histidine kinase